MITNEVIQKIQLVEGQFTPSEAYDVLNELIDVKINFHKLQRLGLCERNENADVIYPNDRIAELTAPLNWSGNDKFTRILNIKKLN